MNIDTSPKNENSSEKELKLKKNIMVSSCKFESMSCNQNPPQMKAMRSSTSKLEQNNYEKHENPFVTHKISSANEKIYQHFEENLNKKEDDSLSLIKLANKSE